MNNTFPRAIRRTVYYISIQLLFCALNICPSVFGKEIDVSSEYKIKAVFLFNFVQFTEWPAPSFPDPAAPIRIGVLGQNPFGSALDEAVRDERAHGRKLLVQYGTRLADLRDCQLLFIGESEKERVVEILRELGSASILTVSELPEFGRRGGIIQVYNDGRKVRFQINLQVAQQRGLKLDSQLLSLAKIVPNGGGK